MFNFIQKILALSLLFITSNAGYAFTDSIPPAPTIHINTLMVYGPFSVGLTFSEPVASLDTELLMVENGEIISVEGSETSFSVLIAPHQGGQVRFSVPEGVTTDAAGNGNLPSGILTVTFMDEDAPTVELSADQTQVEGDFPVNVLFNEPVTDLEITDFNISNGAGVALDGSGAEYTLTVSPGTFGGVAVFLPSEVAFDTAGNGNLVSNFLQINFAPLDTINPTVELETAEDEVDGNFIVEVRFSETVEGLDLEDFEVSNGSADNLSGNGSVYTVEVSPLSEGEITVSLPAEKVVDGFDNPNDASNEVTVTYVMPDLTRPLATLVETGEELPDERTLEISFSEDVTTLDAGDLMLDNATIGSIIWEDGVYTLTILPVDEGMVMVQVPEGVVTDGNGNTNLASEVWIWDYFVEPLAGYEPFFDFTGERNGDQIELRWRTNIEENTARYELKHAMDLINFQTIETLESLDSVNVTNEYAFDHLQPLFGTNNYFVRIYDLDGSYKDSEIISVDFTYEGPDAIVYPSPARDEITLNTTPYAGIRCEIMIVNSLGQIYYWETYDALPYEPIKMDVSRFSNGMYAVQFWIKETSRIEEKFIILR